ncbi:MAG: hypothetical protein IPO07_25985 [Haliscomenobacter sp.]|nr:hypothetical protein [Haliscomenobacter sp.]MBK9491863.1 hypothetical protein [Haliscomenobacter sp.]
MDCRFPEEFLEVMEQDLEAVLSWEKSYAGQKSNHVVNQSRPALQGLGLKD